MTVSTCTKVQCRTVPYEYLRLPVRVFVTRRAVPHLILSYQKDGLPKLQTNALNLVNLDDILMHQKRSFETHSSPGFLYGPLSGLELEPINLPKRGVPPRPTHEPDTSNRAMKEIMAQPSPRKPSWPFKLELGVYAMVRRH